MRIYDIILKKRNGESLTPEEIDFLVGGYARGEVADYQMAAWLMAVFFRGMNAEETANLTMAMVRSGRTLDLSCIPGVKVDKHSTGGVGDKTTLVLGPLLAAAGIPVVKMSGRSLGHTGGTLDKLESIPGFSVALTPEQMVEQVRRIGVALAGQTTELVPADKKIYNLRDLTATVECTSLIAASVMSKKIAAGADAIVLDVKAGSGAFMKTVDEAKELARAMVEIGRQVGRDTVAAITDMGQPLGRAVGNAIEVREAIETLRGEGPEDLTELCVILGGIALVLGKKASTQSEGEETIRGLISSGAGLAKFRELVQAQGGDPRVADDDSLLPQAPVVQQVTASHKGFVSRTDAMEIALAAGDLGAGRGEAGASPDLSVGVYLHKKVGDRVYPGESLAELHAKAGSSPASALEHVLRAYEITNESPATRVLVHEIIR